jgi:phosphoribosylglycinamide formyltransferase-1
VKTLAILISGQGTHLANLERACRSKQVPARIGLVLSNRPQAPGVALAQQLGLPVQTVSHTDFDSREAFDDRVAQLIESSAADLVVLAGFMRILTEAFVRRFEGRLVNIHPSLLPAFAGLDTHERALQAGVRVHGATVHLVTPTLDHGPILAQAVVPVREDDNAESLRARVLSAEHRIYPPAVRWLLEDRVRVTEGRALVQGIDDSERLLMETQQ